MTFDARKHPRVNLRAFIAIGAVDNADVYKEYNAVCINISEGGCCFELESVLSGVDIDFGVKVGIDLPDTQHRLISDGKIIWLKEEDRDKA